MEHIDNDDINTNLQTRIAYILKFIDFGEEDIKALHDAATFAATQINAVVDAVYSKLFSFDITRASFLPRNDGYDGDLPASLEDINHDAPQIKFRKDFLRGWAAKIFTSDYSNPSTWEYFDKVGIMHTGVAGFKHRENRSPLHVDYVHIGMLMGYVEGILISAVLGEKSIPLEQQLKIIRAINKILWIQNDLMSRHYIPPAPSSA